MVKKNDKNLKKLFKDLGRYDQATAAQAAGLLLEDGLAPDDDQLKAALKGATEATRQGFAAFLQAWRQNKAAAKP